jgi:tellurite resistance-related uncharacterized protein
MSGTGPIARRGALPAGSMPYRTIGPFNPATLPSGLRAQHSLKDGVWALLKVFEGSLRFVWDDAEGGIEYLVAPAELIIPPLAVHHVEETGPFRVTIAFHR